jgi:hypothetical protein
MGTHNCLPSHLSCCPCRSTQIEINGTGIAGLSNMPDSVVGTVMRSFSELPAHLGHIEDPLIMVSLGV